MTRGRTAIGAVLATAIWTVGPVQAGMGQESLRGLTTVTIQTAICQPVEERLGAGALARVIGEQLVRFGIRVSEDPAGPRLVAVIDCSGTEIVPGRHFWRLEMAVLDAVDLVRDPSIRVPSARVWSTSGVNGLSEPARVPDDVARGVEQVLGDFLADHQAMNASGEATP